MKKTEELKIHVRYCFHCFECLQDPTRNLGAWSIDDAHVKPKRLGGSEIVLLCPNHHRWHDIWSISAPLQRQIENWGRSKTRLPDDRLGDILQIQGHPGPHVQNLLSTLHDLYARYEFTLRDLAIALPIEADALRIAGNLRIAWDLLGMLSKFGSSLDARFRAGIGLVQAKILNSCGAHKSAVEIARRVLDLLGQARDEEGLLCQARSVYASQLYHAGYDAQLADFLRGIIGSCQSKGGSAASERASFATYEAHLYAMQDDFRAASRVLHEAKKIRFAEGDPRGAAILYGHAGMVARRYGAYPKAIHSLTKCMENRDLLGDAFGRATNSVMLGDTYVLAYREHHKGSDYLDKALKLYRSGITFLETIRDIQYLPIAYENYAYALSAIGDRTSASKNQQYARRLRAQREHLTKDLSKRKSGYNRWLATSEDDSRYLLRLSTHR